MKRTLTLKRESLAALTGEELGEVNGAAVAATVVKTACVQDCLYTRIQPRCYGYSAIDCLTRACG